MMSQEDNCPALEQDDDILECAECGVRYRPSLSRDFYPRDGGGYDCEECMLRKNFVLPKPVSVDDKRAKDICKYGRGPEACRYLMMGDGLHCAKGSDFQSAIDERAPDMRAQGDNCSGQPDFASIVAT